MAITLGPHPKIMFRTDYLFHLSQRSSLFSKIVLCDISSNSRFVSRSIMLSNVLSSGIDTWTRLGVIEGGVVYMSDALDVGVDDGVDDVDNGVGFLEYSLDVFVLVL